MNLSRAGMEISLQCLICLHRGTENGEMEILGGSLEVEFGLFERFLRDSCVNCLSIFESSGLSVRFK